MDKASYRTRGRWGWSGRQTQALCVFVGGVVLAVMSAAAVGVPWHLDRIDQERLPLDGHFTPPSDGSGVHAFVIDTGIRRTHQDFEGRVDWVGDFVSGNPRSADAD